MMERERVPVRIGEERHQADPRVVRLRELELDAGALEALHDRRHVRDPQGDTELGQVLVAALLLRRAEDDADVVRLELRPALTRTRILLEAERLAVELRGPVANPDVDADEVRALDLLQGDLEALGRCVAAVQLEPVPVRVGERRSVAHARVERVHSERRPLALELLASLVHVLDAKREHPAVHGQRDRQVPGLVLGPPLAGRVWVAGQPQCLAVELLRPGQVFDRHRDEIDVPGLDQPTEPSICNWMSLFISTAYSSGSSFVIGSTNPETTIADASASERPRDMR